MADYSITIANSTSPLGMSPPVTWNAFTWGSSFWGYTGDFTLTYDHLISEAVASTPALTFAASHDIGETLSSDSAVTFEFSMFVLEGLTLVGDLLSETLGDGSGYSYVYPDRTTDAEGRDFPTWTSGTAQTSSWSTATAASTTWS